MEPNWQAASLLRCDDRFVTALPHKGCAMIVAPINRRTPFMAGLHKNTPVPTEIRLHQQSRLLEIAFPDGNVFRLPYEYLRVHSPSAEVRGHGPGQETLQTGKRNVDIATVEAVGNYAIRPTFSDGHDSGIYSWDLLYELGINQESNWQAYLARLAAADGSRDIDSTTLPPKAGGCGKH